MKKRTLTLLLSTSIMLAACNNQATTQKQYIEPKYEETVYFQDRFDKQHIDVTVNDERKMYHVGTEFEEIVKDLEKNDLIKIEYTLDSELKKVVKDIEVVQKNKDMTEEEKLTDKSKGDNVKKASKDEEEKKKEKKTVQVYDGEEFEEKEADTVKYKKIATVKVLDGFVSETSGEKVMINNEEYNTNIELKRLDDDVDIKKQRWRAAEKLEDNGILKETKEIIVPNVEENTEFIFYSQGDKYKKYILIKRIDKQLTNIEINIPNGFVGKQKEYEVWAMIQSFKWEEKED